MKYLWLLVWFVFIIIGAFVGTIVPDSYVYSVGFTFGCFSYIFIQLFDDSRRK